MLQLQVGAAAKPFQAAEYHLFRNGTISTVGEAAAATSTVADTSSSQSSTVAATVSVESAAVGVHSLAFATVPYAATDAPVHVVSPSVRVVPISSTDTGMAVPAGTEPVGIP